MLGRALNAKTETENAAIANATLPIGRTCADMVLAPIIQQSCSCENSITNGCKLGNPALVSAHFADPIDLENIHLLATDVEHLPRRIALWQEFLATRLGWAPNCR